MSDLIFRTLAFFGGIILGIFFFGGLWLTTRKALASTKTVLWIFGSLIIRMGTVLLGFYWVMQRANWLDGLICLLGFFAGRFIVIGLTKTHETKI